MAKPNAFDIPRIYYFESGNIFTGSRRDLNFRIVPDKEQMHVSTWHGMLCSELADMEDSADFPLSTDGHEQMLAWLEEVDRSSAGTTGPTLMDRREI
ncbi:MAG: hypothetical protein IJ055_02170 [Oscillospiraceae bacterium]|nr:hypothetical protein [Oscillospiraceae bacterium]